MYVCTCIKILPDVEMVKRYTKLASDDFSYYNVIEYPPSSCSCFPGCSYPVATCGLKDTVHHPYFSTCYCRKCFTPLYVPTKHEGMTNVNITNLCVALTLSPLPWKRLESSRSRTRGKFRCGLTLPHCVAYMSCPSSPSALNKQQFKTVDSTSW